MSFVFRLGLFSEDSIVPRKGTPLDTLCFYLQRKLAYDKDERDVAILRHDVGVKWPDSSQVCVVIVLVAGFRVRVTACQPWPGPRLA